MRGIWMGSALAGLLAVGIACGDENDPADGVPCEDCGNGGTGANGGSGGAGATGGTGGTGGSGATGGTGGSGGGAGGSGGVGGTGGSVFEPVCKQVPDCEAGVDNATISSICLPEGCSDAGQRDGGELLRGAIMVYGFVDPVSMPLSSIRSYAIDVFHPTRNDGSTLTCAAILAKRGVIDESWNVLRRTSGDVPNPDQQIPAMAQQLPVNDAETPFLAHLVFFGGGRDTSGRPTGSRIAESCVDGIVVPAGAFAHDEDHVFSTKMERPTAP